VDEAGFALENTMFAFQQAVDLGFRYIETDAHVSSDGVLVAAHDPSLERTTDGTGVIEDHRYADLTKLKVGGREAIPRFEDVLATWPDIHVNVDAKTPEAVGILARMVHRHRAWDRVCVASFSAPSVYRLRRELGPRVATALSWAEVAALMWTPTRPLRSRLLRSGQAAQVPPRHRYGIDVLTPAFVDRAHELGTVVNVWTINDAAEMHRVLDLGADGVFTDRLDIARDVFREREIWPGGS
ncbi:MAG TPA: glycerophosphodiester phosphodiesterase family protein, partial [Nocardioidaceae bacterium]|nr:glycerophosphodiester phosphodiesterase family protein [Nocardioidaceae bacterium]